ncbi:Tyrosine-protein kinase etk [compost metagenome]
MLPGEHEFGVSEMLRVLWQRKRFIASTTVIAGMCALAVSFVIPKTYSAEATLLPQPDTGAMGSLAATIGSQLGAAAGMLGGMGTNKADELVEILNSRNMTDRVIAKCQLDKELTGWKFRSDLMTKTRKMVKITGPTLKNKLVIIKVDAPKAELAARIANTYVAELKGMLDEIGYNQASKDRRFIEAQLAKTKQELAVAEEKLSQYQAKHNIAALPETVGASIKTLSALEAQQIEAEAQLRSVDETLLAMRSGVSALQSDPNLVSELELKRKGISAQKSALNQAKESFIGKISALPPKAMAFARLQRDVQVQNAIYLALSQQFEAAVITESKDSDAFLPLDKADIPERASKPKKKVNTALGLIVGFLLGCLGVLLQHRERFSSAK